MSNSDSPSSRLDHGQLVDELGALPEELSRLLQGISNDALRRPASGGGWGVVEVLCHLLDWDEIFLWRLEAVLDSANPDLPAFDGALWDIEHDYRSQDPRAVLAKFADVRGSFTRHLVNLDAAGWVREGNHSQRGSINVEWLAAQLRDHSREHLAQIHEALA
ncbi:MAG: DinB family protein [Thermomicrobiales bacterium]